MKKTILFPGSFDPFTIGHQDIVNCVIDIFDTVIIGILDNSSKIPMFDVETRVKIISEAVSEIWDSVDLEKIQVVSGKSIVEIASNSNCEYILRGVRNIIDFENEMNLSRINLEEFGLSTIFVPTALKTNYVSSTFVKEMLKIGRPISDFIDVVSQEYYGQ